MKEAEYMRELLHASAKALPDLRLFRRNVGTFQVAGGVFRAGIKGQADVYGYERGTGRAIEIECKGARGSLTKEQIAWRDWCRTWGVRWVLCEVSRLDDSPSATIERWVGQIREAL